MKQLTIRGFDNELERRLRELAEREGISLNQAALRLLRSATGLGQTPQQSDVVGTSLDCLIGTWSDREASELMEKVEDFEQIDDGMWR